MYLYLVVDIIVQFLINGQNPVLAAPTRWSLIFRLSSGAWNRLLAVPVLI